MKNVCPINIPPESFSICSAGSCDVCQEARELWQVQRDQLTAANARIARLEEALTPSAETKVEYIGEVSFYFEGGGEGEGFKVAVPWTATKEIMAMILARANRRAREALETT